MTIVLVGGGSGGHITPILAVAEQLKKLDSTITLIYIGQKGDKFADIPAGSPYIDKVYKIRAGKFRRYHGQGAKQLLDVSTGAKNLRDLVYANAGFWQSYKLLGKIKPDVIFIKGGFVGLPVGLAAAKCKIAYITHDSDSIPGLANRLIAKWATYHAVGMPAGLYNYPADKIKYVGVPISSEFKKLDDKQKTQLRQELGLELYHPVIMVTGGGLGAQRLNNGVAAVARQLLEKYPKLFIVQLAGNSQAAAVSRHYQTDLPTDLQSHIKVIGFSDQLYRYSGAADLVICRAGATNMAEMAAQAKACIVVPNPLLTGGHQTKNSEYLASSGAIWLVTENQLAADTSSLFNAVTELLDNDKLRQDLGTKLHNYHKAGAAHELALLLLKVAGHGH